MNSPIHDFTEYFNDSIIDSMTEETSFFQQIESQPIIKTNSQNQSGGVSQTFLQRFF